MTTATKASAPVKINLTLHVTSQRDDGYHLLDSLVVFADVADALTIKTSDQMRLTVNGPFANGVPTDQSNLVWKAAELCGGTYDITLTKNIPHGAGLGGGSADAAAVLRLLDRPEFAPKLGADVPVCLWDRPQRMRGIGERLDRHHPVPSFALVLVNPGIHVATPDVFTALDSKTNAGLADFPKSNDADWLAWLVDQRNDLEPAAIKVTPGIAAALSALNDAHLARMSGSGSTCFGIYPDLATATAAATRIAKAYPDWWVTPCQTIGAGQDRNTHV